MMSLPSSNENEIPGAAPRYRKPQADIFTVLLVISLLAIILGIVFLYLETADYGDQKTKGGPTVRLESPTIVAPVPWTTASSRRLDPDRLLC
jgi:hypothetical protein